MILFPFTTLYLKSKQTRKEIEANLLSQSFLSDADYKKTDSNKKFFYGRINDQGFILQNISQDILVPFLEGNIFGAENDIFIHFRFKGFKSTRVFLLLIILLLGSLGFIAYHVYLMGLSGLISLPAGFASIITLILLFVILSTSKSYFSKLASTIDYFNGLFDAEVIDKAQFPSFFRE